MVTLLVPSLGIRVEPGGRYVEQLLSGLRFIRGNRLIRTLVIAVAVTNFIDAPLTVAFPVFARDVYDSATALGLMFAATGAGALIGTFIYGGVGRRFSRRRTYIFCFIAASAAFGSLVALPPLAVTVAILVLGGAFAAPLNPVLDTVFQERVPPELRGRVFGAITALAWIAMPLGALVGGALLELLGLRATLAIVAVSYLVATVSMLFIPALHEMDRWSVVGDRFVPYGLRASGRESSVRDQKPSSSTDG
jgi:MFS family permease